VLHHRCVQQVLHHRVSWPNLSLKPFLRACSICVGVCAGTCMKRRLRHPASRSTAAQRAPVVHLTRQAQQQALLATQQQWRWRWQQGRSADRGPTPLPPTAPAAVRLSSGACHHLRMPLLLSSHMWRCRSAAQLRMTSYTSYQGHRQCRSGGRQHGACRAGMQQHGGQKGTSDRQDHRPVQCRDRHELSSAVRRRASAQGLHTNLFPYLLHLGQLQTDGLGVRQGLLCCCRWLRKRRRSRCCHG
jgi:hypothetical protein